METKAEKSNLRRILLEKRDSSSIDFIKIASKQIHNNLKQIDSFRKAQGIASYFPLGSEVKTQDIMQEILADGKELSLPRVIEDNLSFRKIGNFDDLEKGSFNIMEPKEDCPESKKIDVVLVPSIGITRKGIRLGYGYGYYDRFLASSKASKITLNYSKQIVKSIPFSENDIKIDWIVTEDEYFKT